MLKYLKVEKKNPISVFLGLKKNPEKILLFQPEKNPLNLQKNPFLDRFKKRQIFVEICRIRSDFDENLLEFHEIFCNLSKSVESCGNF